MMSLENMCLTLFSANMERVSLDLILSMCLFHFKPSSICKPKNFSDLSGTFFPILESATPYVCWHSDFVLWIE